MGIAQIALDPLPRPFIKQANVEKMLQNILASLYTSPSPFRAMPIHMETTHLKWGLPLST